MAVHNWRGRLDRRADLAGLVAASGAALAGFLLCVAVLVSLSSVRGPVHSVEIAPGALALRTAGADPVVVVASAGVGMSRLSLTGLPVALLAAGGLVGALGPDRRWSVAVGAVCGVAAAGTLPVLWGCSCGSGAAAPLWRSALSTFADGSSWLGIFG